MGRAFWIAVLLVLAFAPAALAQDNEDVEPEETPVAGCERGAGTDADYAYCGDPRCPSRGADADYVYDDRCCQEGREVYGPNGDADYIYGCVVEEGGAPKANRGLPIPRARPLAATTLPLTGGEAPLLALLGAGLVLTGAGVRLRLG